MEGEGVSSVHVQYMLCPWQRGVGRQCLKKEEAATVLDVGGVAHKTP